MIYTVGEMAKLLGVAPSTLRYYDREGLLPFVERSESGIRVFTDENIRWLRLIECLKQAGMTLRDIRTYIEMSMEGDDTIEARLDMFVKQRERLVQQIAQLQQTLEMVEYKCWYYETAKAAGSTEIPKNMSESDIPEAHIAARRRLRK